MSDNTKLLIVLGIGILVGFVMAFVMAFLISKGHWEGTRFVIPIIKF